MSMVVNFLLLNLILWSSFSKTMTLATVTSHGRLWFSYGDKGKDVMSLLRRGEGYALTLSSDFSIYLDYF